MRQLWSHQKASRALLTSAPYMYRLIDYLFAQPTCLHCKFSSPLFTSKNADPIPTHKHKRYSLGRKKQPVMTNRSSCFLGGLLAPTWTNEKAQTNQKSSYLDIYAVHTLSFILRTLCLKHRYRLSSFSRKGKIFSNYFRLWRFRRHPV